MHGCAQKKATTNAETRRAVGWQDAENIGSVRELGLRQTTLVVTPVRRRSRHGLTVSERSRNGFGDVTIGTAARRFHKI